MSHSFWHGRRTLLTGNTGFKGSWLSLWLLELGAKVAGYSLPPPTSPSLFAAAKLATDVDWLHADVRDLHHLRDALGKWEPEIVFHLAAQPLVRASYEQPVETFDTNVMGTVNVLEAARHQASVQVVIVVTSDKCYENREWLWPYREDDALGGHDPYSASKACAELVTASYRRSLLPDRRPAVATVRAGNVVGGGDWARDRLVPDMVTALAAQQPATIRNPGSIRPWQHVTEPLAGYLLVAERLHRDPSAAEGAWNFGPNTESVQSVATVAEQLCRLWGEGASWVVSEGKAPHEARMLTLDSSKARARLGWAPRLDKDEALSWTVDWYKAVSRGADAREQTLGQLRRYQERLS